MLDESHHRIDCLLATIGGALWGAYKWVEARIYRSEKTAADAAMRAECKVEAVHNELQAHKLHVAQEYVSKDGLREFREEMKDGFKGVTETLKGVNNRIDRFIDKQGE